MITKNKRNSYLNWTVKTVKTFMYRQFNQWFDLNSFDILNIKDVDVNIMFTKEMYNVIYTRVGYEFAKESYKDLTGEDLKKSAAFLVTKEDGLTEFEVLMQQYLSTEVAALVTNVNNTTKELLRKLVIQAQNEGLGQRETARLLRKNYEALTRVRANTIARTELLRSSNYGSITGARLSGLEVLKTWNWDNPREAREDHRDYSGTEVPIDEPFFVGGEELDYPNDPKGSAANTINCMCYPTYRRA